MLVLAYASISPDAICLTLSRFIGVELHGEESSVTFSRSIGIEFESEGSIESTCTEHEF